MPSTHNRKVEERGVVVWPMQDGRRGGDRRTWGGSNEEDTSINTQEEGRVKVKTYPKAGASNSIKESIPYYALRRDDKRDGGWHTVEQQSQKQTQQEQKTDSHIA